MKIRITLLLAAVLCAMSTWATDYSGTMTVKTVSNQITRDGSQLHITQNDNGTYNASMGFSMSLLGQTVNVDDVEFEDMLGVTFSDGYTTISGTKSISLLAMSGLDNIIPSWLKPYLGNSLDKTVPIAFSARFNDQYATAAMSFRLELSITVPILGNTVEVVNSPVLIAFEDMDPNAGSGSGVDGDANGDGIVDINDVNHVVNIMLAQ